MLLQGFIRLIDALYSLGHFREASDALQQAVQQDAAFRSLPEYKVSCHECIYLA
jgi:hypothetical protein